MSVTNAAWRTSARQRRSGARHGPTRPQAPPTPRLARNFFIKAPSPYAAYFFVFGP